MAESRQYRLIGKNYTTPDLVAKVTGKAKYAEDYRADGMLFAKLLLSPMPHARVTNIDASRALAMPGVKAVLTVDDLPPVVAGANLGEGIIASAFSERGLTNEPLYEGEPILAVAAVDELTAAEAIEKIDVTFVALPFVVDPVESLRPGGANARTEGNAWVRPAEPAQPGANPDIKEWKWTADDFANAGEGQLPTGKSTDEWTYGDLAKGFADAAVILDETFVGPNTSHVPLETRTAMAYWQNGKLYMHCSTQSVMRTVSAVARWVGIKPEDVVIISEYTGGGFGSKGSSSVFTVVPALLSKKTNAPVMMRVTRDLASRDTTNAQLRAALDTATQQWGVKVMRIELKNITPPEEIRLTMEKQMTAERTRRAVVTTAEGEKASAILRAEGQKQSQIVTAEGSKQAAILAAEGQAEARLRVAQAEAQAIQMVAQAIGNAGNPAQYLIAQRYLESLNAIASGANKLVFMPYEASGALASLGGIKELLTQK